MKNINHIIFISTLCSPGLFDYILKTSSSDPGIAIQKFHSLLISGLAGQDCNAVEILSAPPITPSLNKKRTWNLKSEYIGKVKYNYIFTFNLPVIRNVIVFFHAFFKILFWKSNPVDIRKVVICDALKKTLMAGAYFGCKLRGIKMIAILTDIPGFEFTKITFKMIVATFLSRLFLTSYDGYILLTSQMHHIVNPKSKPEIIMEGLVDINIACTNNLSGIKNNERTIIYSGGIHEQYGIKMLINAFMKLEKYDIRLDIYGCGPMEKELPKFIDQDPRIRFYGLVPNDMVVEKLKKATLLVNPRPSHGEYTKYSFPSKNMEYMASGTPLVTTRLPGMPEEYLPFVYLFDDESTEGILNTLKQLLNKTSSELDTFGAEAKKFVLTYKNNFEQGRKITNFINQILPS